MKDEIFALGQLIQAFINVCSILLGTFVILVVLCTLLDLPLASLFVTQLVLADPPTLEPIHSTPETSEPDSPHITIVTGIEILPDTPQHPTFTHLSSPYRPTQPFQERGNPVHSYTHQGVVGHPETKTRIPVSPITPVYSEEVLFAAALAFAKDGRNTYGVRTIAQKVLNTITDTRRRDQLINQARYRRISQEEFQQATTLLARLQ